MKNAEEVCVRGEERKKVKVIEILDTGLKIWLHNTVIFMKGITLLINYSLYTKQENTEGAV